MDHALTTIWSFTAAQALGFFLVLNAGTLLASAGSCWLLGWLFPKRRLFDRWEPFKRIEVMAALGAVGINAVVSVAGWMLWKNGIITLESKPGWALALDVVLMVVAMDLGMYGLHRVAHWPWLYPLLHRFHHRHEATNPISLFVLHPLEVMGFGALMIAFLCLHAMDPRALVAYLTLNVMFGTIGHCGVEPFPAFLRRVPLLRLVGTSTFHAGHHEHPACNFGFYTLVWDKLFGTLDPHYRERYQAAAGEGSASSPDPG